MDPGTSLDLIVLWKYKSFKSLTDIKNQLTINLCKSVSKAGIENWNKVKWPSSPNTSPASTANDRELMAAFVFSGSFFRQHSLFFLPALPYFLCRPWSITINSVQSNLLFFQRVFSSSDFSGIYHISKIVIFRNDSFQESWNHSNKSTGFSNILVPVFQVLVGFQLL